MTHRAAFSFADGRRASSVFFTFPLMRPQSSLGGDHRRMPMGERDCACHRRGAREIPWIELRGSQGLVEDRGCRFLGVAMDSREIEVLDGFSVSFWIVGFFFWEILFWC